MLSKKHATAIYLAVPEILYNIPRHRYFSLYEWLECWDVHHHAYKIAHNEEIFQELLAIKPIKTTEDLNWINNALLVLNPYPKEDACLVISILKNFLNNPIPNQFPQELLIGVSPDTQEILTTESDNSLTPVSSLSIPAQENFNSINSEQLTDLKSQLKRQLPSRLATLLAKVSKTA